MRNVGASKTFNKFQTFERSQFSLLILEKKIASYKNFKNIRAAIASVIGLVYLRSNLQIIILRFRT